MKHWRTTELQPGLTADQLARRAGRSVDAARSAAKRHGVPLAAKHRGWPARTRQRAMRLRQTGMAYQRVAQAVGVPASTVRLWAKGAA